MKKNNLNYLLWTSAACVLIGVAGVAVYFPVKQVEVRGSTHYTDEQVIELVLTGPLSHNTLTAQKFFSRQMEEEPYVENVSVSMIDRDTLLINIREKKAVGCVQYLNQYIYFDQDGTFIESSPDRKEYVPFFPSETISEVNEGEKLNLQETELLDVAETLSAVLEKYASTPDKIELNESRQVLVYYEDITVNLGSNELLEDKMLRAFSILPKLTGKKGILHLDTVTESSTTITFEQDPEQWKEEQTAAEPVSEASGEDDSDSTWESGGSEEVYDWSYDSGEDYDSTYDWSYDSSENYDDSYDWSYDSGENYDSSYDWNYDSYEYDDSYDWNYDSGNEW